MIVKNLLASCTAILALAGVAFAVDSEPVMKVKVCNPAETFCADVSSVNALKTDATITSTVGAYVDKGAFIYGSDKFNPTGGIFQDALPTLASGTVGVSRMTQNRALHVNLRDSSGVEFATTTNPLVISPSNAYGSFVFGDVTTVALTLAPIRRTPYIEQTTNAQRSIASLSALDTSAGTGARQVKIYYCTAAMACGLTETVTLNGLLYVNTVSTTISYIEKMEVVSVGSTGSNAGIITLKAAITGGGVTIGTIAATDNQTFWAHHYIDAAKTCNITGFSNSHSGTTVGSGGVFILKSKNTTSATAVELQISDFNRLYGQDSANPRSYGSPIKVVGPSRLIIYVTPETSSSTIYRGALDFYEQ